MILFILNAWDEFEWKVTAAPFTDRCEYVVIPLKDDPARHMNSLLADYNEPFFITLHSGDTILEGFLDELQQIISGMDEEEAGTISDSRYKQHRTALPDTYVPILWRTKAVKESEFCFPERPWQPFEHWILQDTMYRLSNDWTWKTVRMAALCTKKEHIMIGKQEQREWELNYRIFKFQSSDAASDTPIVSIVLCTYNNADYLPWAIRSVLAQSASNWELILVDDGSEDETYTRISSFLHDPRVRLLRNEHNQGKSYCLNLALNESRAPWILELDDDDWLSPDTIMCINEELKWVPPSAAMVYGNHYEWTENTLNRPRYKGIRKSELDMYFLLTKGYPIAPRLFRAEALRSLGGWFMKDPFQGRLFEDFLMIIRLTKYFQTHHLNKSLYHRRIRPLSITHQRRSDFAEWRNWIIKEVERF